MQQVLDLISQWSDRDKQGPTSYAVIVDTGSTTLNFGYNVCPCLTRSRCAGRGYWSMQHGRPLTISELARLQGFDIKTMNINVSEPQMGAMIGNGFSVNVWRRVFNAAVVAAEGA